MRLAHTGINFALELTENVICVLCIDKPDFFSGFVEDLWRQQNGETGELILSEGTKELSLAKEMQLIINPFEISCNSKKIVTKLYQELAEVAQEEYSRELALFHQEAVRLLDMLSQKVPYQIDYDLEFDVEGLLKMYHLKINADTEKLVSRIIDYMRITHQVMRQSLFVFVNLKSYLTDEELTQMYEFVFYEKIKLILLENSCKTCLAEEKCWIIDKDLCIIEVDELTAHGQCDGSGRIEFEV